jgi:preprotein translocase subunit YajC
MKFAKLAILATAPALALAVTPIAANAQDVGTTVYGNDDAPIGTVEANAEGVVTVNTGKHMAPLPANLLAEREGKWTVNATQVQINGMMDQQVAQANAARDAALVQGAAVMSADGMPAGTIYTIDSEDVVIVKNEAGIVTLTREAFAADANGALMALYSAEQLAANTVEVPEGAEILTPAQAAAKEAEGNADAEAS